ncbi:unnamed protein product [Vitrella brassicaformis CCMP3155]|uniref:Peptidyl-prolyl cis-trans isomerase n=1 Tax=Vitrella brassicaformis (strain CCMP3155) TaxID=1169540 RepID=A0A0G4FQA7_VITBC|nr:unnamed protein product [Vitrella brassicaformis CCMP3155]|mmetsp:Transcript_6093/g.14652  ORF Transcript_6093/g.14652 Transcript_6093/m.14652 type:complete len:270 (-) Transcript_6093:372-1181(-)|eukprot:CEM16465.1 unnamed protein product [Vitrella brassicaformis CCMP3155]
MSGSSLASRFPKVPSPRVFLDMSVGGRDVGRLVFELFADELPITAENFRCLCTGETGLGYYLRPRWYKGVPVHRVVPGFMCQGGDFNMGDGHGGESIYGQFFRDEKFLYKHSKRGVLSMAKTRRRHSNNSQFFITFAPCPWLDGKHVVFGQLIDGWDALEAIEDVGTVMGRPRRPVTIYRCGELLPDTFRDIGVADDGHIDAQETRQPQLEGLQQQQHEGAAGGDGEELILPSADEADHFPPIARPDVRELPPDDNPLPIDVWKRSRFL